MREEQEGYWQLVLFSLLGGLVGIVVKLIKNLDVYSIVFIRALIASVFILAVIVIRKRTKELSLVYPLKTVLVGVFQGLSIFLFFSAVLQTTVSNAIFLVYTAPIFSVVLAKFFLKESIERETLIGMIVTLTGILFILDPTTFAFNSNETLGNLMGLASGFFYAAMALTAKPVLRKVSGYYTAFWQYFVISILFVFFFKADSYYAILENGWQLLFLGVFCTGVAFILFMEGVKKVKAQKIFIVTSLEPLVGTIFALLLLAEIPSLFTIAGAILILYGVYIVTKQRK